MIKKTLLLAFLSFGSVSASTAQFVYLDQYPIMSNLDYTGFNRAPEIGLYLAKLAQNNSVEVAFETGTFQGDTSIFLSHYFEQVFTVEIMENTYKIAKERLQLFANIECFLGSSETVLHQILPSLADKPILFYLDAHWHEHWPLLDELEEISLTHKDNCIIVIDDFKVPGRHDIPYDAYGKNECSFEYINKKLSKIFTDYDCYYLIPKNVYSCAKFVVLPINWHKP